MTANVFMVGVAYQAGFIPLPGEAIERAIELNGTAVEANLVRVPVGSALDGRSGRSREGRRCQRRLRPAAVSGRRDRRRRVARARRTTRGRPRRLPESPSYAARYVGVVVKAHQAEQAAGGDGEFATTVARQLHHVMAYKDEYEVARLLLAGRSRVAAQFGDDAKMTWNLYPPMLRSMGSGESCASGVVGSAAGDAGEA